LTLLYTNKTKLSSLYKAAHNTLINIIYILLSWFEPSLLFYQMPYKKLAEFFNSLTSYFAVINYNKICDKASEVWEK